MSRFARAGAIAACAAIALVAGGSGDTAAQAPPSGEVAAALSTPGAPAPIGSERIYFVMTDRYADGDTSNDKGAFDPTSPAYFHGGDLRGLTGGCTDPVHGLQRLKDIGFTAIWITPPVVNQLTTGSSAGYHGYWGLDFTTVDPHLGSEQDFADFVGCAHRLGLKVIMDVVVNHTGDVIQLRGGSTYSDAPYRDCKGRVFKPAAYVGKRTFPCLAAAKMPRIPVVFGAERNAKKPAWLNDPLDYHDRGDIDFGSCSPQCFEQGDFYGLDDLFTEKPAVERGLAAIYAEWIRKYRLDGFRIDTARHVNAGFFKLWVPQILAAARAAGVQDFQLFGEVPLTDPTELSRFVRDRGLPNVLDFPFQDAAVGYASGKGNPAAVTSRLSDDDYFRLPDGSPPLPPTFLGNHDMGRAALRIAQAGFGLQGDELLRRTLLGYDLLYLLRGAPVVYYGDEVGMLGTGGDQQARQDMFPTKVAEWRTQARVGGPPIGAGSSFDVADNPIEVRLRELAALRAANPALATGASIARYAKGDLLVLSRIDAAAKREYVVAFNSGAKAAAVSVATATPSSAWTPLLGGGASSSGADGRLAVTVPPLRAVVLRADAEIPVSAPAPPRLKVGPDDVTELTRLTATVSGRQPVTVAFAVRRGNGAWKRVAVDDAPPYRGFLEPARFRKKERVELVAIARSLDGRVAVSPVVKTAIR